MAEEAAALLSGDTFLDRRFEGGDLTGADLGGKELTGCTFKSVRLAETRWREARLEDCRFDNCDLSRMTPDGLSARDVVFSGCKLMGVEWSNLGAYPALTFERCDLRYASVVKVRLRKIAFTACNLEEAQFVETDLAEASFADCRLAGARFERCDLRKASFAGATGLLIEPGGNQLRGARIPVETAIRLAESFGLKVLV
ncbi:MAG TPA: pentapeptide repeat-containing protein [Polyangia bacterium]|nr:pentapeptide repeat-containing protein [Polyangia bacterium]